MTSTRSLLVGLACVAVAVPLSVTLSPPSVGVAPASACSGTAFMMGSPRGAPWAAEEQAAVSLPKNGAVLVFQDRKQPFSWKPKGGDELRLQSGGVDVPSVVSELVPGLFAIAPTPSKVALSSYRAQWHDGIWKHVTTFRREAALDEQAPAIERVGMLTYEDEGPPSSCGSHGPLAHVVLAVRDASPVVLAAWAGSTATGAPADFAIYDASQPEAVFALGGKPALVTVVAFDAASQRSLPVTVGPSPSSAATPARSSPAPRQPFGCGKSR